MLDPAGKEWSIGAEAGRSLKLDDEGVSAFHAKITHDDARWRIIDQMSANGTWVNDDKVTVSYLANGDRIRFAQVECEIQLSPAGRSARPRPADGSGRSSGRTWMIAVAVAVVTVAALALLTWLG
jgi:pSer/pThr/pTyr-binding forkhead associated (FHA) protein